VRQHNYIARFECHLFEIFSVSGALSGDPFGAPLPHDWFQPAVATMPATAYLLPVGSVVSSANVTTRGKNYTVNDSGLLQLLRDAGLDTVADLFPSVGKLRYDGSPVTSVAVTCVIGISTPTPLSLHYDIPSFSPGHAAPPPVVAHGDGDGTVNRSSAVFTSFFTNPSLLHTHPFALFLPPSPPQHLPHPLSTSLTPSAEKVPTCARSGREPTSSISTKWSTCISSQPARACCLMRLVQFKLLMLVVWLMLVTLHGNAISSAVWYLDPSRLVLQHAEAAALWPAAGSHENAAFGTAAKRMVKRNNNDALGSREWGMKA
jgi:hypothetical protein